MSGHSKWSSIKHKKAAADARRGKVFTKLIREITVAARLGGGDAEANPRLRQALDKAKAENMPKDTIQRAITKGVGGGDGTEYEEVIYEGYGPANVAVVIEALTDNRNRTVSTLRYAFGKHNGSLGSTNSVQYMFERKGAFSVPKDAVDEDTLTEYVADAGGEDIADEGEYWFVTCPVEAYDQVKSHLEAHDVPIESADLQRLPQTRVTVEDKDEARRVLSFLEVLEEDDDVQRVFSNFDIDDGVLAELV